MLMTTKPAVDDEAVIIVLYTETDEHKEIKGTVVSIRQSSKTNCDENSILNNNACRQLGRICFWVVFDVQERQGSKPNSSMLGIVKAGKFNKEL